MTPEQLIEAVTGYGWDVSDPATDLTAAMVALTMNPALARSDVFTAAALGEVDALGAMLIEDPDAAVRPGGPRGWPPLLYAAFSFANQIPGREDGLDEVTRLLLSFGADPDSAYQNPEHDNGFSALYGTIAVTQHRARTEALLDAGARPSDGNSTYHAVETFDIELLRLLAAAGIDRDDASYTIKHAVDMGWDEAVRLFLDQGADPNATHPAAEETTLHWAIKRGASEQVVGWLLEAGADPMAQNAEGSEEAVGLCGRTPYDYALRLGHPAAEALKAAGATADPPGPGERFVFAVARGDFDHARALAGVHPGLLDSLPAQDRGLLPYWSQHGRQEAVAVACMLDFPVDATSWMGLTALHWAALRGDPVMVSTLLGAGAPALDLGPPFGTPEHTAETCQWYAGDYEAVLVRLREPQRGPKPNPR